MSTVGSPTSRRPLSPPPPSIAPVNLDASLSLSVVSAPLVRPQLASLSTQQRAPLAQAHVVEEVPPSFYEPFCWIPSTLMVLRELCTPLKGLRSNLTDLKNKFDTAKITKNYQDFVSRAFDCVGRFFMNLYFIFWFPAALHHLDNAFSKFHPYISNMFRFSRKIPPLANHIFHTLYNSFACAGSIIGLIKETYYLKQILVFRKTISVSRPEKNLHKDLAQVKLSSLQSMLQTNPDLQKYLRPHIIHSIREANNADPVQTNKLLREVDIQTKKLIIIHIIGLAALSFILAGSLLYLIGTNALITTAFTYTLVGLGLEIIKDLYIKTSLDSKGWKLSPSKLIPQKLKQINTWKTVGATVSAAAAGPGR